MQEVEKTKEDELTELKTKVGQAFFDYGRLVYEIHVSQNSLENIRTNLHNWDIECKKIQSAIDKEKKLAAMEVKLPPPEAQVAQ